jgi:phosphoribosyl 1,2-cyclic phosphodiesterase
MALLTKIGHWPPEIRRFEKQLGRLAPGADPVPGCMKVTFLGTRGNIPIRSPQHRWHSAMLLSTRKGRVLIDCGEDWLGRVGVLGPTAILVTHGHPDHAGGLKQGATCPVYATAATWRIMDSWPIGVRCQLPLERPVMIAGFVIEAWPVLHSLNAPAVGFKISTRDGCVFYVPDVAALEHLERTLRNVDLYVGDGAVLVRSLVRRRGRVLIGHASVATQLDWCRAGGVPRAIFTHCGSAIVRSAPGRVEEIVESLGRVRGLEAALAYDGLTISLSHSHLR